MSVSSRPVAPVRSRTRVLTNLPPTVPPSGLSPEPKAAVDLASLTFEWRPIASLKPNEQSPRKHSQQKMRMLEAGIRKYRLIHPFLVGTDGTLITGHARLQAAKNLGITSVPVVIAEHLSATERRAFMLADNRFTELGEWDPDLLRKHFEALLLDLDFNIELTGFPTAFVDLSLDGVALIKTDEPELAPMRNSAYTEHGDLWQLGRHRLICGDARDSVTYERLLQGEKVRQVVTDPPYGTSVARISGLGRFKHREFELGSGISNSELTDLLNPVCARMAEHCLPGALAYLFMDHIGLEALFASANANFSERKALLFWKKTNAGMGSLYRQAGEFCAVYKVSPGTHVNNINLGVDGRYRTTCIEAAGVNTFRKGREEDLARHPTSKPVVLIADLIRDASRNGDLILDCFIGGGSTIIAAERTRRRCAGIEIDRIYCDLSIERWQEATGEEAILVETGETYAAVVRRRGPQPIASAPAITEGGDDER